MAQACLSPLHWDVSWLWGRSCSLHHTHWYSSDDWSKLLFLRSELRVGRKTRVPENEGSNPERVCCNWVLKFWGVVFGWRRMSRYSLSVFWCGIRLVFVNLGFLFKGGWIEDTKNHSSGLVFRLSFVIGEVGRCCFGYWSEGVSDNDGSLLITSWLYRHLFPYEQGAYPLSKYLHGVGFVDTVSMV